MAEDSTPHCGIRIIVGMQLDIEVEDAFVLPNAIQFILEGDDGKDVFCTLTNGGVLIQEESLPFSREVFHSMVENQKGEMIEFAKMKAEAYQAMVDKLQEASEAPSPGGYG